MSRLDALAVPFYAGLTAAGVKGAASMLLAALACGGWPPGASLRLFGEPLLRTKR